MKEWALIRNDGFISMVYYQIDQPEFNPAFGNVSDFQWRSRDITETEYNDIVRQKFLEVLPQFLPEFMEAFFEKQVNNNNSLMNGLMTKWQQIKSNVI